MGGGCVTTPDKGARLGEEVFLFLLLVSQLTDESILHLKSTYLAHGPKADGHAACIALCASSGNRQPGIEAEQGDERSGSSETHDAEEPRRRTQSKRIIRWGQDTRGKASLARTSDT